ncbi:hypothetical protein J2Z49_000964 [Desulfofundulus luciae]|uniref:Uncharacterized protein n=1 Tax=Desulfofundulus luciae TaxID=74702 RepID=A0ABU0AZF8_9FIRM|nr:hypothetical protein [Desulfofundulus luciae]
MHPLPAQRQGAKSYLEKAAVKPFFIFWRRHDVVLRSLPGFRVRCAPRFASGRLRLFRTVRAVPRRAPAVILSTVTVTSAIRAAGSLPSTHRKQPSCTRGKQSNMNQRPMKVISSSECWALPGDGRHPRRYLCLKSSSSGQSISRPREPSRPGIPQKALLERAAFTTCYISLKKYSTSGECGLPALKLRCSLMTTSLENFKGSFANGDSG